MDFRGRGRHTTFCGGVLSIILLFISGFVTYKYISDFIATDDPDIKIATAYESGNFPKVNLFDQRVVFAFSLSHYDKGSFTENTEFSKYMTIHLSVITTLNVTDPSSGTPLTIEYEEITFKPCNILFNPIAEQFKKLSPDVREIDKNTLCMDISPDQYTKLFVENRNTQYPNTNVEIRVLPCSLADTSLCKVAADFDKLQLVAHTIERSFDPANKNSPLSFYLNSENVYYFDINNALQITMSLKTTTITDDKTDEFLEGTDKGLFAQIDRSATYRYIRKNNIFSCPAGEIVLFNHLTCPFYFSLKLSSGGTVISIQRSYVSLLSTLSDIGGFFDIAVLLAGLAFCFCEDYWFKNFLRQSILRKDCKEYGRHMDWLKNDEVHDIMEEILDEHQDGIELYRRMGSMKILEQVFFKECHKTLVPYILMLQKNLNLKEEEEL